MNQISTMPDLAAQALRYALFMLGGYMTKKGIDGDTQSLVLGAVTAIATLAWGVYVKYGTKAVPVDVAARPTVPTVNAITGQVSQ